MCMRQTESSNETPVASEGSGGGGGSGSGGGAEEDSQAGRGQVMSGQVR